MVERLVGFEGVISFLILLGFASDEMGLKLICEQKPAEQTIKNAVDALSENGSVSRSRSVVRNRDRLSFAVSHSTPSGPPSGAAAGGLGEEDTLTLEQIIVWSTHEATRDSETMETLIITHRTMTDSLSLLKQLRRRFAVQIPAEMARDEAAVQKFRVHVQKSIQLKVVKALRDWMKLYWDEDFSRNLSPNGPAMLSEITRWLNDMRSDQDRARCKWLKPLADTVRNELDRNTQRDDDHHGHDGPDTVTDTVTADTVTADTKRVHLPPLRNGQSIVELLLPMAHDEHIDIPRAHNLDAVHHDDVADQITLMDYAIFK